MAASSRPPRAAAIPSGSASGPGVALEAGLDGGDLAHQAGIVDAGAATGPFFRAAAEQSGRDGCRRRGVADAHFAETDEVEVFRHRAVAGRDGGEEGFAVHCRHLREIAGRTVEVERNDVELRTGDAGELVDGGAAAGEIRHHLHGDLRREGRYALRGDAVVAGKDQDFYAIELRHVAALPAGQPSGYGFQSAKAALRLGQRVLAAGDSICRGVAAGRQIEAGRAQFIKRFERHGAKISETESGKANGSDEQDCDLARLLQRADRIAGLAADLAEAKCAEAGKQQAEQDECGDRATEP